MADYIDKNILVQAYVRVDKDFGELSDRQIREIESDLRAFAMSRAEFFLGAKTEVSLETKDGSIINKISVLGTIAALYAGIANYPSFREGVILLHSDAKRLVEFIVSESMFAFRARANDSVRIEARVGVIGSLHRIVQKIDSVRFSDSEADLVKINIILSTISDDTVRLLGVLKTEEDRRLTRTGLLTVASGIPKVPKRRKNGKHLATDIDIYIERRRRIIDLLKNGKIAKV